MTSTDAPLFAELSDREKAGVTGWLTMGDSLNAQSVLNYPGGFDLAMGYPGWAGQGEILPGGQIAGWTETDFAACRAAGMRTAAIANLTPDARWCSNFDYEAGALTGPQLRQGVLARNAYRPGTATTYASLDSWPAVARVLRGVDLPWAGVAFWPNYPSQSEVDQIEAQLRQLLPRTLLAYIQYRNLAAEDVDLGVIIRPRWASTR